MEFIDIHGFKINTDELERNAYLKGYEDGINAKREDSETKNTEKVPDGKV